MALYLVCCADTSEKMTADNPIYQKDRADTAPTGESPHISVIMAVYNTEPYLEKTIRSVLAQTYEDFEFLIHDDGSSDGSREILYRMAKQDPRLDVSSGENVGAAVARNVLIARARGNLLAIMDADDICAPTRFAEQVAWLDAHPDTVALGTWAIKIDADGRPISRLKPPLDHARIDANNMSGRTSLVHPSVMLRRTAVERVGGYDRRFRYAQDKELWLRLAETGGLANLPSYLLWYREHASSISTSKHEEQERLSRLASAEAAARRGIDNTFDRRPYRSDGSRTSERDFALKYGWQAWRQGFRSTSRHYALRAIRLSPGHFKAWKLLVVGTLRRSPKTPETTSWPE